MAVNIGPKIGIDGEAEYRKELKAIIQETKTYAAETNEAAAAVENADDKEKASAKVKESLRKQIEAQEKLVKKLREGVENAAKTTGENSETTLKWKEQLAKATTELHNLQGSASGADREVKDLTEAEKEAGDQASIFGDVLKANLASEAIKKGLELTKEALVGIKDVIADSVKDAAAYGDEINTLSKKTGLSTQTLQQFDYMSELIDVDLNTITGSLTKLTRNMESAKNGTGAAAEAFDTLGVSVTDEEGKLRNNQEVWAETIDALGQIENSTERDALAMQIFGKSAQDLNPLIMAGADTLKELQKEAENTGYVLDTDTLDTLNDVQEGFDRLGKSWDTIKRQLGAKVGQKILPDLKDVVGTLQNFAKTGNFDDLFDGLTKSAENALKKLPKLGEKVMNAIPKLINKIGDWIAGRGGSSIGDTIGKALGDVFANAPKIVAAGIKLAGQLGIGIITGIPNILKGIWDGLGEMFNPLTESAKEARRKLQEVRDEMEEIPDAAERVKSAFDLSDAKADEAEHWIEIFDSLYKKTDLTAYESERLKTAVEKLNDLYPDLDLRINDNTGEWSMNTDEIRKNVKALQAKYEAEAYYQAASETQVDIRKLERESQAFRDREKALRDEIAALEDKKTALEKVNNVTQLLEAGVIAEQEAAARLRKAGYSVNPGEDVYKAAAKAYQDTAAVIAETKKQLEDLRPEWEATAESVKEYDDKIAELSKDVEYFYDKAEEASQSAFELSEKTMYTEGQKLSESLFAGYIQGLKKYGREAMEEGRNFIKGAVQIMKNEAKIKSPSKVMEDEIGQNLALGVVKGWEDVFTPTNTREIFSMTPAFDAMTSSMSETTNNVTNNQNYGGFSINVYARDGQDVDALADAIMIKIQRAADARKAVFA